MKRRTFLTHAALAAALVYTQTAASCRTKRRSLRVRKNVASAEAAADIETLKRGVAVLRENADATQYASWMYWANSHGMSGEIPTQMQSVWFRCEHGTMHFLTWHRAYLLYFEELIRQLTNEAGFALPYWDWYASSDIPEAFSAASSNPLHHSPRNFVRRSLLRDALTQSTFDAFSRTLEGNPHGTVHVMVGGHMGSVMSSARDPLFWAHHAQIDRLWDMWIRADSQRTHPTQAAWLDRQFVFDLDGQKAQVVKNLLQTSDLGYRYDSTAMPESAVTVPLRPPVVAEVEPNVEEAGAKEGARVLGRSTRIALGAQSVSLRFRIASSDRARLAAAPESSSGAPSLVVRLGDVESDERALAEGFEYRFYVNLPTDSPGGLPHEAFYVGSLTSFQLTGHAGHSREFIFPLQEVLERQRKSNRWSNDEVFLSILSTQDPSEPLLSIGRVELVVQAP